MKERYEEATAEVIEIKVEDIITTSGCETYNPCDAFEACPNMLSEWD